MVHQQTFDVIISLKSLRPDSRDPTTYINVDLSKLKTNDKCPLKRVSKNAK